MVIHGGNVKIVIVIIFGKEDYKGIGKKDIRKDGEMPSCKECEKEQIRREGMRGQKHRGEARKINVLSREI